MQHRTWFIALMWTTALMISRSAAAAPELSFISPANGPTVGTIINIHGDGFTGTFGLFTPSASMTSVGELQIIEFTDNKIVAVVPQGQGFGHTITVTVQGESASLPGVFSYNPPVAGAIDPQTGPLEGGNTLTINGLNFGLTPMVRIGGQPIAPFQHTHAVLKVTMPPVATEGPRAVEVVVGGQTSNSLSYLYEGSMLPIPVITQVTPSQGPTAGGAAVLVKGLEFGPSPVVRFDGVVAPTLFSAPGMVLVEAPEGEGSGPIIRVENDGVVSNPFPFTYQSPVITGFSEISPEGLLTIYGRNFGLSPMVTFDGQFALIEDSDHHTIQVTPPNVSPGTTQLVIITAAGRNSSPTPYTHPSLRADLNDDGAVDGTDLAILLTNWGLVK